MVMMNKKYIYVCKTTDYVFYSAMIVVAANNPFNAMDLIRKHNDLPFADSDLEFISGASYEGDEKVLAYHYFED